MGRVFSREDYDGPPAWWEARQSRAAARRQACDEHGTPAEDESDGDESDGDDDDAPEGDGGAR